MLVLATPACVANQDVKTASKEMTKTLAATRGVEQDFTEALVEEVDRTEQQVERALRARIVYTRIQALGGELESKGDLVGLSKKISEAELRATKFIEVVSQAAPPADPAKADMSAWVRTLAKLPPDAPDPLVELGIQPDELRTLLTLRQLRENAKGVTAELDTHVAAIMALHQQVDAWIQTDVTVKGEDVATTLDAVAKRFPTKPGAAQ